MLLASAPSRERSLLSSRPTSRAHDKPPCQGDPTRREAVLYRSTLHERCKLAPYLGPVHMHWPRGFLTCSWGLVLFKSSCRPGLDRHSSTGVNTLSLRGNISLLSWVCLESWCIGRASKGTCPKPGWEISRWKKEEETRWGLFGSPPAFCTRNPGYYIFCLKHG